MKIKLGKLPSTTTVKMTISIPETLKGQLERYAELYSQTWGTQADAISLVPHILERFLATDAAFRKSEHRFRTRSADVVQTKLNNGGD